MWLGGLQMKWLFFLISLCAIQVAYVSCSEEKKSEILNARGTNLISKGKVKAAKNLFQEAVDLEPTNVGYWVNLGMSQKQLNLIEDAIISFSYAKKLNPHFGNIESILNELEQLNDSDEVMDLSSESIQSIHDLPEGELDEIVSSLTNDAIDLAEVGDLEEALELFMQAFAKNPTNARVLENIGVTQIRLGDIVEARRTFDKVIKMLPEDESILRNLAALEEHEKFEIDNQSDAIQDDDDDQVDKKTLAHIKTLTKNAVKVAEAGQLEDALHIFGTTIELSPKNRKLWENLGVTQMRLGLFDEAMVSFNKANEMKMIPNSDDTLQANMDALLEHIKIAENSDLSTKDVQVDDDVEEEVARITEEAIELADQDMLVDALDLFKQALSKQPSNSQSFVNVGVTQMRVGLLDEAKQSFQKAKALGGISKEVYINNMKALKEHVAYAQSIDHNPKYMFVEYADPNSMPEAEDEVEEIEEISTDAIALAQSGDMLGALKLFSKDVEDDPENSKKHENLGVTQMRVGLLNLAKQSLERAQRLLGEESQSIRDNFAALQEHVEYAESIDHNPTQMYSDFLIKDDEGDDEYDKGEDDGMPTDSAEAIALAEVGELKSALELFILVAEKDPKNSMAQLNVGVTQMRLGLLNKARQSLKAARRLIGKQPSQQINDNFAALNEHIQFAKSINHDMDSFYPEYRDEDDASDDESVVVDEDDIEDVTGEAIALAEAGEILEALDLFKQAVAMDPQDTNLQENLGVTQMRLGLLNAAKKTFKKAKALRANMPPGSLTDNLNALKEHFEFARSIKHNPNTIYQEFLDDLGDDEEYVEEYDEEYEEDGEFDDDEDDEIGGSKQRVGDGPDDYTDEAIALAESGDVIGALELFTRAVQMNTENPMLFVNLGVTQMRLGLLNKAKISFDRAKQISGGLSKDSPLIANYDALEEHFQHAKSINHNPDEIYADQGSWDKSSKSKKKKKKEPQARDDDEYDDDEYDDEALDEDAIQDLLSEAIALAEAGDVLEALDLFKEAVEKNPQDPNLHQNLGVTQMRLGLLNAAKASFKRCKSLLGNMPPGSLTDNFNALKEHFDFAKSINHDVNTIYEEYASEYDYDDDDDDYIEGDDEDEDDYEEDDDDDDVFGEGEAEAIDEAVAFAEAGDLINALKIFKIVADRDPANPRFLENLGVTQMRLGLLNDAKKSFKKSKARLGDMAPGTLNKNIDALQEHFQYAKRIQHDPNKIYAEYLEDGEEADEVDAEDEYDEYDDEDDDDEEDGDVDMIATYTDEAIALSEAGDVLGSLELFKKAVDFQPQDPNLHQNLGVTQMRLGLLNAAKASFKRCKSLLGNMPPGSLTDNFNALKEHFDFAKSINHDVNTIYEEYISNNGLDDVGYEDDEYEDEYDPYGEDEEEYEDDDSGGDSDLASLTDEAIALAEAGDLVGSLELFKQAAQEQPNDPKAQENLGVTQMRLGLLNAAKKTFKKAKDIEGVSPSGSLDANLGALEEHFTFAASIEHDVNQMYPEHRSSGDDDDYGDDEYDPYEEDDEDDEDEEEDIGAGAGGIPANALLADRLTYKAIAMANEGDVEEAYKLFQEAVEASPKDGQLWENLGITQIRMSMLEEAESSFIQARKLDKSLSNDHLDGVSNLLESRRKYGTNSIEFSKSKNERKREEEASSVPKKKLRKKTRQTVVEIGRFSDDTDEEDDEGGASDDMVETRNQKKDPSQLGNFFGVKKTNSDNEVNIHVDVSQSLGVGLTRGARIDHVKDEGQFQRAGARPGDRIVAVESSMVYTLDHFKTALKKAKDEAKTSVMITIKQNGREDENDEDEDYDDDTQIDEKTQRRLQKIQKLQNKFREKKQGGRKGDLGPPRQQQPQSEDDLLKHAMSFVMDGKMDAALPLFIDLAQLSPNKVESFINLGNIQRDTGHSEDAMVSYRRAFELDPTNELLISNYEQFQDMSGSAFKSLEVEVDAHSDLYEDHNAGLIHTGKCGGHAVSVGDRVEVRDSEGEWGEGTVEAVSKTTGAVQVVKDDWDMSYEWDECRFAEKADGLDESNLKEQVIWRREDGNVPRFEGTVIYEPEQLSRIVKHTVEHEDMSKCGSSSFHVIYDINDDMIIVAIDNFLSEQMINQIRNDALGLNQQRANIQWSWAFVHPDQTDPSDRRKGNGFPGRRSQNLPYPVTNLVRQCLKPIMEQLDDFDFDHTKDDQTLFGLVHQMDDEVGWLDSQRIPHNDIRWDIGAMRNGHVPKSFASVLPLTTAFNESGTGLWYEKSTGDSLLKTVSENSNAQGSMNPHVKTHLHPEVDLYQQVPDPAIHAVVDHVWAKCFMVAQLRFNRFVLYDGRRLHQQYVNQADEKRLSIDPKKGRLTMNSFFWAGP